MCLTHGTSGNFTRPSKENKKQDVLFYDAFLALNHLHALFDTLHAHAARAVRNIACGIQNIEKKKKDLIL